MIVRDYREGDAAATLAVLERAITTTGRVGYTEDQVDAWLGGSRAVDEWNVERLGVHTLVRRGLRELTARASLIARPVFERAGFRVVHEEPAERGETKLLRFYMVAAVGEAQLADAPVEDR